MNTTTASSALAMTGFSTSRTGAICFEAQADSNRTEQHNNNFNFIFYSTIIMQRLYTNQHQIPTLSNNDAPNNKNLQRPTITGFHTPINPMQFFYTLLWTTYAATR